MVKYGPHETIFTCSKCSQISRVAFSTPLRLLAACQCVTFLPGAFSPVAVWPPGRLLAAACRPAVDRLPDGRPPTCTLAFFRLPVAVWDPLWTSVYHSSVFWIRRIGSVGPVWFWDSRIRFRNYMYRYGSVSGFGCFHQHAKLRKIMISTAVFRLLKDTVPILSLKTDVYAPTVINMQKISFMAS